MFYLPKIDGFGFGSVTAAASTTSALNRIHFDITRFKRSRLKEWISAGWTKESFFNQPLCSRRWRRVDSFSLSFIAFSSVPSLSQANGDSRRLSPFADFSLSIYVFPYTHCAGWFGLVWLAWPNSLKPQRVFQFRDRLRKWCCWSRQMFCYLFLRGFLETVSASFQFGPFRQTDLAKLRHSNRKAAAAKKTFFGFFVLAFEKKCDEKGMNK